MELLIDAHYCKQKGGCTPFAPTVGGAQLDYFDTRRGPHRCDDLAAYLKLHNSWVDELALSGDCLARKTAGRKFPVPDIITHTAAGEGEFYEIKPASASGRAAGAEKIAWFNNVIGTYGLPYEAGKKYHADERLRIWGNPWFGQPVEVYLHWWLDRDGLILYELCVDTIGAEELSEVFLKMLVAALLAALILLLRGAARSGGGVIVEGALADSVSPMRSPLGPPDGVPAIDDVPSLAYVYLLTVQREDRRGHSVDPLLGHLFSAEVVGTDPPEGWEPGDARPWQWNAPTMAAIADIAPDGRFEPNGRAVRELERDQLLSLLSGLTADEGIDSLSGALAGAEVTDEEGDGGPVDAAALAAPAVSAYFQAVADEMLYFLTNARW
ncbi:hypothetical protein [Amycolatopsis sp. GM8]|uniref:hypothetical protein n=1 Tax=Amycolatopsis sp. GM8 TaxID=2896530 RepID=UPI001F35AC0B|nr:hypothetical protein [Amycolatopsis sp. GM8]